MYTVNEVAEILHLSHWTIRKKIASGSIESVKIFGAIRIPPEEKEFDRGKNDVAARFAMPRREIHN